MRVQKFPKDYLRYITNPGIGPTYDVPIKLGDFQNVKV